MNKGVAETASTTVAAPSSRRRSWLVSQLRNIAPFVTLLFLVGFFTWLALWQAGSWLPSQKRVN